MTCVTSSVNFSSSTAPPVSCSRRRRTNTRQLLRRVSLRHLSSVPLLRFLPSRRSFPSLSFPSCCRASGDSAAGAEDFPSTQELPGDQAPDSRSFWKKWQTNAADMRAKVAKLGLSAVLAYGLIDGITYTTFFVLAFLGYEKSTGKNPAANIQALLGIVILMWTGNNVTRPFRVAGAAALAPFIDKALQKLQRMLNLPNQLFAFMVVVATFASLCFSVVGLLILSRWGK